MLSSLPWLVVMVAEHRIIKKCIDQMYRAEFLKTYKNSFFLFIFHYKSNSIRDGENWNSTNWDNIKSVLWHLSPFLWHCFLFVIRLVRLASSTIVNDPFVPIFLDLSNSNSSLYTFWHIKITHFFTLNTPSKLLVRPI